MGGVGIRKEGGGEVRGAGFVSTQWVCGGFDRKCCPVIWCVCVGVGHLWKENPLQQDDKYGGNIDGDCRTGSSVQDRVSLAVKQMGSCRFYT